MTDRLPMQHHLTLSKDVQARNNKRSKCRSIQPTPTTSQGNRRGLRCDLPRVPLKRQRLSQRIRQVHPSQLLHLDLISHRYISEQAPRFLFANKIDKKAERVVSSEEGKAIAEELGLIYWEVSAATGENVQRAFEDVVNRIYRRGDK